MSQTLQDSIAEYRRQFKADPATADKSILENVQQAIDDRLQADVLDADTVHAVAHLSGYYGINREKATRTLARYLTQPLPVEEEAWARWFLVDHYAMLERCEETIETQQQFLAWARTTLISNPLLWVMYDSTQAMCWVELGKGGEWLQIFHELMAEVAPSPKNRPARLIYIETATVVLNKMDRPGETLALADAMRALSEEDPTWERALEARLESHKIAITAYHALHEMAQLRSAAAAALELLEEPWQNHRAMSPREQEKLMVMSHNLGSTLYLVQQYELAIPPLRRAVELNSYVEHTYLWLAASLWATTKDRAQVLPILRQGAQIAFGNRGLASLGYDKWTRLPEFEDVKEDPEFLEAVENC